MRQKLLIAAMALGAVLLVVAGAATALVISSDDDQPAAPSLGQAEGRGYLGVSVAAAPIGQGVRVTSVDANGPAARAGIQAGDVIRSVDGELVRTPARLQEIIEALPPGTQVSLTYERGAREFQVRVTLGRAPDQPVARPTEQPRPLGQQRQLGVRVALITPALRLQYNLTRDSGVVITDVLVGSPAMLAGLREGDVLLRIDGRPIERPEDVTTAINATTGSTLSIVYLRGSSELTTTATFQPVAFPGFERLPPAIQERLRRAIEQGSLSPGDIEELQRQLLPDRTGARFGIIREVSEARIVLRPLDAGDDFEYVLTDLTEYRKGAQRISRSDLQVGESVVVISLDGRTALGVLSFGTQDLPPPVR